MLPRSLHLLFLFSAARVASLAAVDAAVAGTKTTQTAIPNPRGFPPFTPAGCASLPTLVCHVQPTAGHFTRGLVYFSPVWVPAAAAATSGDGRDSGRNSTRAESGAAQMTCHVRIRAAISGLRGRAHGFHIHTYGDLSATDGKSTGGHFFTPRYPAGPPQPGLVEQVQRQGRKERQKEDVQRQHGLPADAGRHWGDLGNIFVPVSASSGTGEKDAVAEYDRVDDVIRLGAVLGRAITIHEGTDKGPAAQPSGGAGARVGHCVIGYANPAFLSSP